MLSSKELVQRVVVFVVDWTLGHCSPPFHHVVPFRFKKWEEDDQGMDRSGCPLPACSLRQHAQWASGISRPSFNSWIVVSLLRGLLLLQKKDPESGAFATRSLKAKRGLVV